MADAPAAPADAGPWPRPTRPTTAELRAVTQPPAVRGRRNSEHWVADLYLRAVSPHLTRVLLRLGLSANAVTWIMIATGASAGLVLLVPGLPGATLALLLGQLQMLWDCSDGEVARWRRTFSPAGTFLDKVGHFTAESLIPLCLGWRAAGPDASWSDPGPYAYAGALLAVLVVLNKALNDMVHVARAFAGLPRLADAAGVGTPTVGWLARLRRLVRFFPFNRVYHSVEMTIVIFLAAIGDAVLGGLDVTRWLLVALLVLAVPTVLGHLVAILSSTKLAAPAAAAPASTEPGA
ncbi:MAG: CDP-alcohol phosphatidyltransferase family protein [Candidatus Nanopelagicales bacterium]|nr:CDP-alcohol phosphatidyltransferase family protein [Candidatus Nanopelagicales bacterium]